MLTISPLTVWAIMPQPTAQYGQIVGTARAFWMRSVRAWATDGARLRPSAPSVPSAAETPPDSLMKSRRDSAPRDPASTSTAGAGTDAAIRATHSSCLALLRRAQRVVNTQAYTGADCHGPCREAYTASGHVR